MIVILALIGLVFSETIWLAGFSQFISNLLINLSILLLQFGVVTLYFSIKNQKFTNIIDRYIGTGDLLFFAVLCSSFSPLLFLILFQIFLVLTIIGHLILSIKRYSLNNHIPLVGYLSVFYGLTIITNLFLEINLLDDSLIRLILNYAG